MPIFHKQAHTMEAVLEKLEHANSSELEICNLHVQRAPWREQKMKRLEVLASQEVLPPYFTIRGYVAQICKRDKGFTWPFSSVPSMEQLTSIEVLLPLTCAPSHVMPLDVTEQGLVTYESTAIKDEPLNADFRLHVKLGEETKRIDFDSETGIQIHTVDGTWSDPLLVEASKSTSMHLVIAIGSDLDNASANDDFLNEKETLEIGSEPALEQRQFTKMGLPVKSLASSGSSYVLLKEPKEAEYTDNLGAEGILQKEQPENSTLSGLNNKSSAVTRCAQNLIQNEKKVLDDSECNARRLCSESGEKSLDSFEDIIEEGAVCNLKVSKNTIVQADHDSSKSRMSLGEFDTAVAGREPISISACNSTFDFNQMEHIKPCLRVSCLNEISQLLKPKCKVKRTRLLSEIIQSAPQTEVAGDIADSGFWSSEELFASMALRNLTDRDCDKKRMGFIRSSGIESTLYRKVLSKAETEDILIVENNGVEVQSNNQKRKKEPAIKHISRRAGLKRKCFYDSMGTNKRRPFSRKSSSSKFISEPKKGFELHLSDSSSCSDCEKNISRSEQSKNYVYKIFKEYSKAELPCIDQPNDLRMPAFIELATSTTGNVEKGRLLNRRDEVRYGQDNNNEMVMASEISRSKIFTAHADPQGIGQRRSNVAMQTPLHEQPQSLSCGKDMEVNGLSRASGLIVSSRAFKCQESHDNELLLDDAVGICLEHHGNITTSNLNASFSLEKKISPTAIQAGSIDCSSTIVTSAPYENMGCKVGGACRMGTRSSRNEWQNPRNFQRNESCDAMKDSKIRSTMSHSLNTSKMQSGKSLVTSTCGTNCSIVEMVERFDFSDKEPAQECENLVKDLYGSTNQKGQSRNQRSRKVKAVIKETQPLLNNEVKDGCEKLGECAFLPQVRQTAACIPTTKSNMTLSVDQSTMDNGAEVTKSISPSIPLDGTRISHKRLKNIARQSSQNKFCASSPQKMSSELPKKKSQLPQTFQAKLLTNAEHPVCDGSMRSPLMSQRGLPSGRYSFIGKTLYRQSSHRQSQCSNAVTPFAEISCYNRLKLASSKEGSARDPSEASQLANLDGQIISSCQVDQSENKCHCYTDKGTQSIVCSFPALDSGASSDLTHEIQCVPGCLSMICQNEHIGVPDTAISSNVVGLGPKRAEPVSISAASTTRKSNIRFSCASSHNAQSLMTEVNGKEHSNSSKERVIRNQLPLPLQSTMKGSHSQNFCVAHKPPTKFTAGIGCHQNEGELRCYQESNPNTGLMRNMALSQSSSLRIFNPPQCSFAQNSSAALHIQPSEGFISKHHNPSEASNGPRTVPNNCCRSNKGGTQFEVQARAFFEQEKPASGLPSSLSESIGHTWGNGDHALQSANMSPNLGIATGSTSSADFWSSCIEHQSNSSQSGPCFTLFKPAIIRKRKISLLPSCIAGKKIVTLANQQTVGSSSSEASALGSEKG